MFAFCSRASQNIRAAQKHTKSSRTPTFFGLKEYKIYININPPIGKHRWNINIKILLLFFLSCSFRLYFMVFLEIWEVSHKGEGVKWFFQLWTLTWRAGKNRVASGSTWKPSSFQRKEDFDGPEATQQTAWEDEKFVLSLDLSKD